MKTEWPRATTPRQRAATNELLRRLHAEYASRIASVFLFGSVARGDFTPESDIDLLIVADQVDPALKWDIWGIGAEVSADFDVRFNLHVYPASLWEELRAKGKAVWRNVEREGIELRLTASPA